MTDTAIPARDLSRLDAMVSWLENNPKVHDQRTWVGDDDDAPTVTIPGDGEICGTVGCLAGWTLLFDHEHYGFDAVNARIVLRGRESRYLAGLDFEELAGARLGLTDDEAIVLFHSDNSLGSLRQMVTDLQAGVDITAEDYDPAAVRA